MGRPRLDGLVPGSPEAAEADQAKDRERKRVAAAKARATLLANRQAQAPSPLDSGPPPADHLALVPWEPDSLKPLFAQLLPALQKYATARLVMRAESIGPEFAKEVEKDAAWPGPAVVALEASGPQALARVLNRLGLPPENAPEIICATAVAAIAGHYLLLHQKLNRLLAQAGKVPIKQAPCKAPPATAAPSP